MAHAARKRSYEESVGLIDENAQVSAEHMNSGVEETSDLENHTVLHDQHHANSPTWNSSDQAAGDWQLVEGRSKKKNKKRRNKSRPKSSQQVPLRSFEDVAAGTTDSGTKHLSDSYPSVVCAAPHTINSSLRISDLQSLILYCLADGVAPQWISVRSRAQIRKVVVLMIPGLERSMFTSYDWLQNEADRSNNSEAAGGDAVENTNSSRVGTTSSASSSSRSPDDYLPFKLQATAMPSCLKPFAEMFPHMFPLKAPGDDRRVHSPVAAILNTPLTKSAEEKRADKATKGPKPARVAKDFVDIPTPVTAFVASTEDLLENEYVLHPTANLSDADKASNQQRRQKIRATEDDGWKDALIEAPAPNEENEQRSSIDAGRRVFAIDCEMCKTKGENEADEDVYSLTRISVVDWEGQVVIDELVKPERPIVDYLTAFSGMTAERLKPITTTLPEIQARLLKLFTPDSILMGHSLNSDLNAMKMTHPFVVDTSIIYPHPKGPPFKSSLKWLAQKYLNREIQKHDGSLGHDSIEDARAALDLVKAKCRHGPRWGTPEATGEDIFKRLGRTPRPGSGGGAAVSAVNSSLSLRDCRTGAVVDHGRPERTLGKYALVSIACSTDAEVAAGVKRAAAGDKDGSMVPGDGVDFVFARMRELEALRGWSTDANPALTLQTRQQTDQQQEQGEDVQAQRIGTRTGSFPDGDEKKRAKRELHHETQAGEPPSSSVAAITATPSVTTGPESNTTVAQSCDKADNRLESALRNLSSRVMDIKASLPARTLFIVYSGIGDPREMKRLGDLQRQFRREYAVKKWDEITVKWTDTEEQALRRAVKAARDGIGFVTVT